MVKLTIWLGISALSTHTQVFLKSLSSRVKIFRNPKLPVFVASLANKNLVHVLWGLNSLCLILLLSVSSARMMVGAVAPAAATTATMTTAGGATIPRKIGGEEAEGPPVASKGDAATAGMIWWIWREIAGMAAAAAAVTPGAGGMITMTASCEKPWRGRRWASSRGHAAGTDWTARATAQIGGGRHVGPHHSLRCHPLDTPVAEMTTHLLCLHRTVTMKVSHLQRKVTSARWVTAKLPVSRLKKSPHCLLTYNCCITVRTYSTCSLPLHINTTAHPSHSSHRAATINQYIDWLIEENWEVLDSQ